MTIITISEISETLAVTYGYYGLAKVQYYTQQTQFLKFQTLAVTYGYYGLAISAVFSRCQDSEISEIEAVRDLNHTFQRML